MQARQYGSQNPLHNRLAKVWEKKAHEKPKRRFPLPSRHGMIFGEKHSRQDMAEIFSQMRFAVEIFAKHFSAAKRKAILLALKKKASTRSVSISAILSASSVPSHISAKGKVAVKKKQSGEAKELQNFLERRGHIYRGWFSNSTGRFYIIKGWRNLPHSRTTPIHETIHLLQKLGVIKVDVPFAEAVDRFYGLQNGFFGLSQKIMDPSAGEFDKTPSLKAMAEEPEQYYSIGRKIGQWAHKNLPGKKGWDYLYWRCMGLAHSDALKKIGR